MSAADLLSKPSAWISRTPAAPDDLPLAEQGHRAPVAPLPGRADTAAWTFTAAVVRLAAIKRDRRIWPCLNTSSTMGDPGLFAVRRSYRHSPECGHPAERLLFGIDTSKIADRVI
jgi:hypothetical protein